MSNYLAPATLTSVLKEIIQEAISVVPGAAVKVGRPSQDKHFVGVYMYLYQVTPNTALSNNSLPTRSSQGVITEIPQTAVDLNYVFSFYGETDLASERMMGAVISILNAYPFLTSAQINRAIEKNSFLKGSDLEQQVERVKLSPVFMSLEELSKLWTVFFQVSHRVALVYQASVLLIDAEASPQKALPVDQVSSSMKLKPSPKLDR